MVENKVSIMCMSGPEAWANYCAAVSASRLRFANVRRLAKIATISLDTYFDALDDALAQGDHTQALWARDHLGRLYP